MFRIVLGVVWLIALVALLPILILPGNLEIYIPYTQVVVAKTHLVLAILLMLVLPLLLLTIWHFRSTKI
jgi:hypothetical protein